MRVKDIMTNGVEFVEADTTLAEIAQKMKCLDVGAIPVLRDGKAAGIITDRDIVVRSLADGKDCSLLKGRDVMTPSVVFINAESRLQEAAELMEQKQVRRLLVVDGEEKVIGIVSLGDIAGRASIRVAGNVLKRVSAPSEPRQGMNYLP